MIRTLKQLATSAVAFCISTSVVFASPGMGNYFKDHEQVSADMKLAQEQEEKFFSILSQATSAKSTAKGKQTLLANLDRAIQKAEEKNLSIDESIKQMNTQMDEAARANQAQVKDILKNKSRFDRIYFGLNRQGREISRKELSEQLKQLASPDFSQEMKTYLAAKIRHAGGMANLLRDIKTAVETNDYSLLAKLGEVSGRSIATEPLPKDEEVPQTTYREYKQLPIHGYWIIAITGFLAASLPIFILCAPVWIPVGILVGLLGADVNFLVVAPILLPLNYNY